MPIQPQARGDGARGHRHHTAGRGPLRAAGSWPPNVEYCLRSSPAAPAREGETMPLTTVGDVNISYNVQGEGDPLLLINGFGSSSAGWHPELAQGLARSFRLVTLDNRGTGLSDKRDEPTSIAQMADDALAVLDALGIERAHAMGISMGGMIAQELALRQPRRVMSLVLGCTNCGAP